MLKYSSLPEDKWLQDEKQLTAGIAHEIKNPLAAIHGFLQLLAQRLKGDSVSAHYIEMAIGELNRLQELMEDYLQFGSIRYTPFTWCDLGQIVDHVVGLAAGPILKLGIRITVNKSDCCPLIKASPKLLHHLLWNLINNAIAALPDGGDIVLDLKQTDNKCLSLSCHDNGIGIPAANLSQVFNPYFTTKDSGTGLGLMISQLIVRAHGGRLEVESELGVGTTFFLWLPIDKEAAE